ALTRSPRDTWALAARGASDETDRRRFSTVPGNRDSARLRRLRERRDRRTPPAPDEHNKAGDQIGHAPHPARITGGEEGVAASSPPPRQSPSFVKFSPTRISLN